MRSTIWTGACTAMVGFATAAMFAQTPAPQQTPSPQQTTPSQQSAAPSSDKRITVTGCLKAAPSNPAETASAAGAPTGTAGTTGTTGATAGTAGTTGTAGAAPSADAKFILTEATLAPADAAGSTTATGSTAASASAASPQTYRLIANPTALTPHVGKKLELTGTLEDQTSAPSQSASGAEANGPALRVEAGKIVAASCTEK
jgi:hypothetical protein